MKKNNLAKAILPFMLIGSPALANSVKIGSSSRKKMKSVSIESTKSETKKPNTPFGVFGNSKVTTLKNKKDKEANNVLSFLKENDLINSKGEKSNSFSGDILETRKEFAFACSYAVCMSGPKQWQTCANDAACDDATNHTVTFDGNGNTSGSTAAQTASSATNLTSNGFTRTGYTFSGWNTAANGSGTAYANNASYAFTVTDTLYAQWTDSTAPTLSSVSSASVAETTVDVKGTSNEAGTMYYVIATSSSTPTYDQVAGNTVTNSVKNGSSAVSASTAKTFSVTGLTAGTQYYFYIVTKDAANNESSVSNGTFTTVSSNTTPTISNATASQAVNDNATLSPFSGITLADTDGDNISVTIALDDNAKGTLSSTSIASTNVAAAQSALRAITFNPTDNRVAPGSTETTTFTITANDGTTNSTPNNTTTVISTSVNDAPTDITLSSTSVNQSGGTNASVGTLSSTDADTGDTATYTLVAGSGDTNNASFNISGTTLQANDSGALSAGTYDIRVNVNDGDANFEKAFTITLVDDVVPTVSAVSSANVLGTTADIKATPNETGDMYYVVASSSSTPTADNVINNTVTNSVKNGTSAVTASTAKTFSVTGLSDSTQYYYYIVTVDEASNKSIVSNGTFTTTDTTAPTVSSVSVPANATYKTSENLSFTVNTNENVTVTGTPRLAITIGSTTKYATYASGSGSSALVFTYPVESGLSDSDGITVGALELNSGTLKDSAGNDMTLTLNSVGATTAVLVDAVAPTVSSVSVPNNATYKAGENLNFTVNASENITVVTTGGTPQLSLTIGSTTRQAVYQSGSGTSALVFRYTVQAGESDTDGIAIGTLALNGGTLKDSTGNDMTLTLNSVGATTAVLVDSVNPTILTYSPTVGATSIALNSNIVLSFSENIAKGTGNIYIKAYSDDSVLQTIDVTSAAVVVSGTQATITHSTAFALNTQYYVTVDPTVFDDNTGNSFAGISSKDTWNFTSVNDTTAPTISSITIPNTTMKIGDTVTATITVTSDSDDYTTGSGAISGTIGGFTLGSLTKTNDTTYTAQFTITEGGTDVASDSSIPVSVKLTDSSSNEMNTAFTTSISQDKDAIDANKPILSSVSISSNNISTSKAKVGDVITLTFTANEALSSNPTVKIAGQNASVINTSANNYTATYTMQSSDTEGVIPFTIDFSDSATNAGTQVTAVTSGTNVTFDKTAPTTTISTIDISADTGSSDTDFITKTASQTITATLSSALLSGEILYGSIDNGTTWINITSNVTATSISWNGVNLEGTSSIKFKVTDATGNDGTVASQTYTLDTTATTANLTAATDDVGTVKGALSSGNTTDDTSLVLSGTNEAGSIVNVYNGTTLLGAATVTGTTWTYAATVADATTYQFNVKETDIAGNESTATSNFTVIGDTTAPNANLTAVTDDVGTVKGTLKSGDKTDDTSLVLSGTNEAGSSVNVYNGTTLLGAANVTGTTWTYAATVADATTYQFNVKETDIAGNESTATSNFTVIGDTVVPSITITSSKDSVVNEEIIDVTFTLSEESSDFTISDITVEGAEISDFIKDSNNAKIYTAKLTIDKTTTSSITIDVNEKVFTDVSGNENSAATQKSITVAPSVLSFTPNKQAVGVALDSALKLEFSEEVIKNEEVEGNIRNIVIHKASDDSVVETIAITSDKITIENPSEENNLTNTTVTINKTEKLELLSEYYVLIDNTMFKDVDGNFYKGISDKTTWTFTSVDNIAPVITNNESNESATITADENQTAVITINATDSNEGQVLTYSISGTDASLFDVNSQTGVVTFKEAPNYESDKKSYTLNVIATDNGGVKLSDTQILTININDVNEAPSSANNKITVIEDVEKILISSMFDFTDVDANDALESIQITILPSKGTLYKDGVAINVNDTITKAQLDENKFTYKSNLNEFGDAYSSFAFKVNDGELDSGIYTMSIDVTAVDDAPVITTVLEDKTVNEDAKELVIDLKDLTTTDVDNDVNTQKPTYKVESSNDKIAKAYIQDGKLIVKPEYRANGVVEISVTTTVNGKSSTKTFKYTIVSVNNEPTISELADISHEQSPSVIEKTVEFTISDDGEIDEVKAQSSNTNLISNDNLIVKLLDSKATLSYTISANNAGNTTITVVVKDTEGEEVEKSFNVNVKAANDQLCVENTKTALTFDTIKNENSSQDAVTSSLTLVDTIESICASTITWSSSEVNNPVLNINDGSVTPPTSENKTITIKANIKKGLFTANKSFLITVPTNALSDEEVIKMINFDNMRNKNTRKSEITSTLTLPTTLLGKTIEWTSNNDNVISPFSGYVTRLQEDTEVVLTATIGNETKEFELKVLKLETSNEEIVKKDTQMLTIESILGKNIDANNVIYDLEDLPSEGVNGSTISWTSSNENIITKNGDVFRDENGDKYVRLVATITYNGVTQTKEFLLTVLQNKIEEENTNEFESATQTNTGVTVTTKKDGNTEQTKSTFAADILAVVENVISQESVKTILEFVDKVVNVYLNTNGTAQTTIQSEDGTSSSLKTQSTSSTTDVDKDGNIESSSTTTSGTVKLKLNSDGSVSHVVENNSLNKTSTARTTIAGSSIEADKDGNVQTTSEVKKDGFIYKAVVNTNKTGETTTRFVKIDLSTGEETNLDKTLSENTPYPSGNEVTISEVNGEIYIKTTTPLDGTLVIE